MRPVPGALLPLLAWAALTAGGCGGGEAPSPPRGAERGTAVPPVPGAAPDGEARATDRTRAAAPGVRSSEDAPAEIVRAPRTDGDVVLIDVLEVRRKLDDGAPLLLIDARGRADYERERIPAAVNVPLPKIAAAGQLPGVSRDYEIVVYCASESCPVSKNAARALASLGYTNVKDMRAGLVGWKQAGFETERGG